MMTNQMACNAWQQAKDMGWEAYVEFDLSDVLEMAAVVAIHPQKHKALVGRWVEGEQSSRQWVILTGVNLYEILEKHLRRFDALA